VDNRRRAERQSAVWMGSCLVEDEPADEWRDCGVFDFSALGAGMDLRHPESTDLVGRRLSVRLPVGASMFIILTGEVRNAKGGPGGIVRLGVEFMGLSDTERAIVDLLERAGVGRPKRG
jgi:PilZ domain-containing protein